MASNAGFRSPLLLLGIAFEPAVPPQAFAGFRSPLFLLGLSAEVQAAPVTPVAGYRSLLAFWAGGAGFVLAADEETVFLRPVHFWGPVR
jgi:hypothetical protein